jgi:hypothetical protein
LACAGMGRVNPVIFCGKLNDEPLAATTQIIEGPGGSEIDFRPGSGFRTGDSGDGYPMRNLYRLLPPDGPNYSRSSSADQGHERLPGERTLTVEPTRIRAEFPCA